MDERWEGVAAAIAAARLAGGPVVAAPDGPASVAEAYLVQARVHARLAGEPASPGVAAGRRIGWKLGCTNRRMQEMLDVAAPTLGGVFEGSLVPSGHVFPAERLRRPGVECEIALRLADRPPPRAGGHDATTIRPFVAEVALAAEVVDDRYPDWSAGAPLFVADDFFHAALCLGPPLPAADLPDLAALAGRTRRDGMVAGTGTGAEVMGDPYAALAWAQNALAARDRTLAAGDIVSTGAVVPTVWLDDRPAAVVCEIDRLGRVELRFG